LTELEARHRKMPGFGVEAVPGKAGGDLMLHSMTPESAAAAKT
jgi:hypothetical protein